jgi:hypothetical protein
VYRVEQEDLSGPWEVTNVLQPTVYENDKGEQCLALADLPHVHVFREQGGCRAWW